MSTYSIGRWWQSATRRRTERGVRVDRAVQELPQPIRHRAPARGAGQAMREIIAQAPVELPPRPAALPLHADTARWLDTMIERLEGDAADDETDSANLLARANWARGIVAELREMKRRADAPAPEPVIDGAQVPDGEEPERVELPEREPMRSTDPDTPHQWLVTIFEDGEELAKGEEAHTDAELEALANLYGERGALTYMGHAPWQTRQRHLTHLTLRSPGGITVTEYARLDAAEPELPEPLTALPPQPSGPAAVPQLVVERARGAYSRYVIGDGAMPQRRTPDAADADADTAQLGATDGGSR